MKSLPVIWIGKWKGKGKGEGEEKKKKTLEK
jgi:hypothetical protein